MKVIRSACLYILLAAILLHGLVQPARAQDTGVDPAVINGCHSIDAAVPLEGQEKILDTAKAVLVYERTSGTMIYSFNGDSRVYPASMVKLMTALVALEHGNLTDKVTVTNGALKQLYGGAKTMGLQDGEVLTLEQLLYCMMVASANDAAVVIAQHVGGSQAGFLAKMNEKAQQLGCRNTSFSNVHGLHDEMTYTTARDVCRVILAGLENELFAEMFSLESYVLPATNKSGERKLTTTNNMMLPQKHSYYDQRVTGGRTGSTDAAGRCIAVTAQDSGMELVCVLMGAEPTYSESGTGIVRYGSFEEMKELLDYVFGGYAFHQLAAEGQILNQMKVENGANDVAIRPVSDISVVLPREMDQQALRWDYSTGTLAAPIDAGQSLGSLQVWYGAVCLGETELIAANSSAVETTLVMPLRPSEMDDRGSWTTLLIIVGIAALVAGAVVAVKKAPKMVRRVKALLRGRRRRKSRRRSR